MTRLSHVGNPSMYEAGDQRSARTESEQLQHKAAEHEHKVDIHAPEENTPQTN